MISPRLRTWLSCIALGILFGGPIFAVLGGFAVGVDSADEAGRIAGVVIRNAAYCAAIGGILRLLVSIDARLEARP